MIDYSITRELANGAIYYKKRDIVREFSASVQFLDSENCQEFVDVFRRYGRQPIPWLMAENAGSQWLIMGRLMSQAHESTFRTAKDNQIVVREEA